MPWFSTNISHNQIIIDIIVQSTKEKELSSHNIFRALLDTGVQSSCISSNVVEKLQLASSI